MVWRTQSIQSQGLGRELQALPIRDPQPRPAQFEYIHWINRYSTTDAVVLEEGTPPGQDDLGYRLLERPRFLNPDNSTINDLR